MILNLSMPDALYAKYGDMGYSNPHQAIQAQLARFHNLSPKDARTLILPGELRNELEKVSGETIDSAEDLLKIVKKLASLKLDGINVQLPLEVRKFYSGQAEFFGKDPAKWISEKLVEQLRMGAGA